jgi:hypothetical protein
MPLIVRVRGIGRDTWEEEIVLLIGRARIWTQDLPTPKPMLLTCISVVHRLQQPVKMRIPGFHIWRCDSLVGVQELGFLTSSSILNLVVQGPHRVTFSISLVLKTSILNLSLLFMFNGVIDISIYKRFYSLIGLGTFVENHLYTDVWVYY